mgnify:CR=1 FL=1
MLFDWSVKGCWRSNVIFISFLKMMAHACYSKPTKNKYRNKWKKNFFGLYFLLFIIFRFCFCLQFESKLFLNVFTFSLSIIWWKAWGNLICSLALFDFRKQIGKRNWKFEFKISSLLKTLENLNPLSNNSNGNLLYG